MLWAAGALIIYAVASPPALGEQAAGPQPELADSPTIRLGLVVTPVLGAEVVQQLADEVTRELKARYPDVGW